MPLALSHGEIETELRRLDADMRRQLHLANLVEEPQVVVAYCHRSIGTGDRFAELGEDQPAAGCGDSGTCCERVSCVLARHELARRALYERAMQSEIVEPTASRCGKQNRASKRQTCARLFFRTLRGFFSLSWDCR